MKNAVKNRINQYLLTWIGSYLLILALPMLLGIAVYTQSVRLLSEEVERVNQKSIVEMQLTLDAVIGEIDRANTNIALNEMVASLAVKDNISSASDLVMAQSIQKMFDTYIISNNNIEHMAVYFHKAEYLLTNQGSYRHKGNLESLLTSRFGLNEKRWAQILMEPNNNTWYFDDTNNDSNPKVLALLDVSGSKLSTKGGATCIIMVNAGQQFTASMQNMAGSTSGDIWIINSAGEYLTTKDEFVLPEQLYDEKVHTIFQASSTEKEAWKYMVLTSRKAISGNVDYIKQLIILHLIICLAIGAIMAYFLARHYYDPIHRITNLIAVNVENGTVAKRENNQIRYIQNSLIQLLDNYEVGQNTIDRQQSELQSRWLEDLLTGKSADNIDIKQQAKSLFPYDTFLLAAFFVQDFSNLFHQQKGPAPNDEQLINLIIENISSEVLGESWKVHTVEIWGLTICIINFANKEKYGIYQAVHADTLRISDIFTKVFGLDVSVLISNFQTEIDNIPSAYNQILELVEYMHMIPKKHNILFYHETISGQYSYLEMYTMSNEEKAFCDYVRRGKFKGARGLLDNVFALYSSGKVSSPRLLTMRVFMLFSSFVDALDKMGVSHEMLDVLLQSFQFGSIRSLPQLQRTMCEALDKLSTNNDEEEKRNTSSLLRQVEEYVAVNYTDVNLGVSLIADQFNINPSQLSRSFKKHKGIGLLDYIHSVRIEHIKELLAGNMTINDIALRTGYYNSLAMIRVYKRYEQVTPGKYREQLRKQQ